MTSSEKLNGEKSNVSCGNSRKYVGSLRNTLNQQKRGVMKKEPCIYKKNAILKKKCGERAHCVRRSDVYAGTKQ